MASARVSALFSRPCTAASSPCRRRTSLAHTRFFSRTAAASRGVAYTLNHGHASPNPTESLRMILIAKPGAGKGTISERLCSKFDIQTLSTGDLLRRHIVEGTRIGLQAQEIIAQGNFVSDDVMISIVTSQLDSLQNKHWILDGFPRTLPQGQLLDSHLRKQGQPLTVIVNLEVPDDVILNRISDRWVHLPSGRVYNLSYNRPKVDGRDDLTGEPLSKRPDDNPETFAHRLAQFYSTTQPLLEYYGAQVVELKGNTTDEIWPRMNALILERFPGMRQSNASGALKTAVIAEEDAKKASSKVGTLTL